MYRPGLPVRYLDTREGPIHRTDIIISCGVAVPRWPLTCQLNLTTFIATWLGYEQDWSFGPLKHRRRRQRCQRRRALRLRQTQQGHPHSSSTPRAEWGQRYLLWHTHRGRSAAAPGNSGRRDDGHTASAAGSASRGASRSTSRSTRTRATIVSLPQLTHTHPAQPMLLGAGPGMGLLRRLHWSTRLQMNW